ncbi:MAG: alpha/beta hydrolase-fold protein [Spirochaetota bacterium]
MMRSVLAFILAAATACAADGWLTKVTVNGTIDGKAATTGMEVYLPAGYTKNKTARKYPLVIALHGWNHSPALWRQKGDLGPFADKYGVVIAVPNMGQTVYESTFYPETISGWRMAPGVRWIGEAVLTHMRKKYSVHTNRAHTAVIGYSTGGRGAVLVSELYPEFAFAGSVSGTFDLMRLKTSEGEYKIHEVVYGKRDKFPERWQKDNCISPSLVSNLTGTALFIGHGGRDTSVRPDQLDALRDALKGTSIRAEFIVQTNGIHDWSYWNSQWDAMFTAMHAAITK